MKKAGLADVYKDYFHIGAAINPGLIDFAGDLIKSEFSSITCENEMKFSSVHPKIDEYTFERADFVADFAGKNNLKMRGHTLVWHQQTGSWLFENDNGGQADKETLYARMKDHIYTVVKRYADKIYCWDVINEAISDHESDGDCLRESSPYYQIAQSQEYIEKAFVYAHEADPGALLFYNEYNTENPAKRDRIYKLLKSLLDKKIPVHGVGIQGHYALDLDLNELQKSIDLFSSLGIDVHITELDISVYKWGDENGLSFDTPPEDRMNKQTKLYGELFDLLRKNKDKVSNVTFWGFCDSKSWLNSFPVKRKNYPLIFDAELNPKDSYRAIVDF